MMKSLTLSILLVFKKTVFLRILLVNSHLKEFVGNDEL